MGQKKHPDELRERTTRMILDALSDPTQPEGAVHGGSARSLSVHAEALHP